MIRHLALCLLIAHTFLSVAQKKTSVQLETADRVSFDATIDAEARFLGGNVRFRHNNVIMYCDSGVQRSKANTFDAFGHIHIIQGDTLHIYGDKLYYNGATRMARLRDNVKMINKETTLTTDFFDYNLPLEFGYYFNNGTIIDLHNKLQSNKGYYYSKTNNAFFKDSVVVTTDKNYTVYSDTLSYNTVTEIVNILGPTRILSDSSLLYSEDGEYKTKEGYAQLNKNSYMESGTKKMWGDTLIYEQNIGVLRARNYVKLQDESQKVIITGKRGIYNELTQFSLITDSALLLQYAGIDTLFLHADTLEYKPDTSNLESKVLNAFNNVRFFRIDVQGKCDSLIYALTDSVILMYNAPILWSLFNQLSGEQIKINYKNGQLNNIELNTNGMIISKKDTTYYDQIKGKIVTGYLKNNKLDRIEVDGNAETIYFPDDKRKIIGCNHAVSSYLTIFLTSKGVEKVLMTPQTNGTFTPLKMVTNENSKLPDFNWEPKARPISPKDIYRQEESN